MKNMGKMFLSDIFYIIHEANNHFLFNALKFSTFLLNLVLITEENLNCYNRK